MLVSVNVFTSVDVHRVLNVTILVSLCNKHAAKGNNQSVSREEFRAEVNTLKEELNSWLSATISMLKTNLINQGKLPPHTHTPAYIDLLYTTNFILNTLHTGMKQCACTGDIKQLLKRVDRVQHTIATYNASYQGSL